MSRETYGYFLPSISNSEMLLLICPVLIQVLFVKGKWNNKKAEANMIQYITIQYNVVSSVFVTNQNDDAVIH